MSNLQKTTVLERTSAHLKGGFIGKGTYGTVNIVFTKVLYNSGLHTSQVNVEKKFFKEQNFIHEKYVHKFLMNAVPHQSERFFPSLLYFDDDAHILGLEYMKGMTIHDFTKEYRKIEKGLTINFMLFVINSMIELLNKFHATGIAHLDIKGDNIIVDRQYNLKVIDFSLSSRMDELLMGYGEERPNYFPPETANDYTASCKVDLYSFGIMILTLITGDCNNVHTASNGAVSRAYLESVLKLYVKAPTNDDEIIYLESIITFIVRMTEIIPFNRGYITHTKLPVPYEFKQFMMRYHEKTDFLLLRQIEHLSDNLESLETDLCWKDNELKEATRKAKAAQKELRDRVEREVSNGANLMIENKNLKEEVEKLRAQIAEKGLQELSPGGMETATCQDSFTTAENVTSSQQESMEVIETPYNSQAGLEVETCNISSTENLAQIKGFEWELVWNINRKGLRCIKVFNDCTANLVYQHESEKKAEKTERYVCRATTHGLCKTEIILKVKDNSFTVKKFIYKGVQQKL